MDCKSSAEVPQKFPQTSPEVTGPPPRSTRLSLSLGSLIPSDDSQGLPLTYTSGDREVISEDQTTCVESLGLQG